MTAPTIHGDPEFTAIVARTIALWDFIDAGLPFGSSDPWVSREVIAEALLRSDRSRVVGRLRYLAEKYAEHTVFGRNCHATAEECVAVMNAAARYALHGTDYADLCASGLTMFSMHLQAQEVAQ